MIKQSPHLLLDKNTLSNAIVCEFDVVIEEISNDLVTLSQQVNEAVLEQYFSRV